MDPPHEEDWKVYDSYPVQFNLYISEILERYGNAVAEKVRSSLSEGTRPLAQTTYNRWTGPRAHWCQHSHEWVWPETNEMTWNEWQEQLKARVMSIWGDRHRPSQ